MSPSESEDQQEPKLVVDTDWKEQVAREKEAAAAKDAAPEPTENDAEPVTPGAEASAAEASAAEASAAEASDGEASDSEVSDSEASDSEVSDSEASDSEVSDGKSGDAESDGGEDQELHPPPPASFEVLVSMLFSQAMALLGQMPDPGSGKTIINKPYAKHYIDTLEMLGEKTKGNLSDQEARMLSEGLHALRMMYVNVKA